MLPQKRATRLSNYILVSLPVFQAGLMWNINWALLDFSGLKGVMTTFCQPLELMLVYYFNRSD